MELLVITGLFGSGKTRALDICEDMDYYCVDNMPTELLERFAELCLATKGRYEKVAMVLDARTGGDSEQMLSAIEHIASADCSLRIIFIEADDATLIRRYKESRRPHPLAKKGETLATAIDRDRTLSAPLRERADYIIDTSLKSINKLQNELFRILSPNREYFTINITSFGFKYGIPPESDTVLDVRCLPNPFYQTDLKDLTGKDSAVIDYIFSFDVSVSFLNKVVDMMKFLLPNYEEEGRHALNLSIGCTGGQHRSVAMADAIADALSESGYTVTLSHRDVERSAE